MSDELPDSVKPMTTDVPDNMERAIAMLRRQRYHEVADYLEGELDG